MPLIPTLVSLADFLNVNMDYLLERTDNPMKIDDLRKFDEDQDFNLLIKNIMELPVGKKQLVRACVKGIIDNK